MTVMLMVTFLLAAFGTTPGALTAIRSAVPWVDLVTEPLQAAVGRWMVFRLTDAQFGLLTLGLVVCLVLPGLVYAALAAPLGPLVPARSLVVWMMVAVSGTYSVCEARHLQAYVREKHWERAARLIDG